LEASVAHAHDHHGHEEPHNDIVYPAAIPFVLVHLSVVGIIWTGFTTTAVILCVVLYLVRMWALTAGFHRYFSHRSYKTSRVFQFILAFLGQTSAQRGVLWWSAIHRHHHRHSDTPEDVHSPVHAGFLFSHVLWIFSPQKNTADYSTVQDLARYPELRLLDRHPYVPAVLLAVGCYLLAGWPGLFVGFLLSTVILYHAVFAINSVAHVVGNQRYVTGDESKNNWWLALITLGEGWHNNHHHYQSSTRQGFFWWEIDISYYVLKVLSWFGIVWDLRAPPEAVVQGEERLGRKVIEKTAEQVALSFPVERIARQLRETWDETPSMAEIRAVLNRTRESAQAQWEETRESAQAHWEETRDSAAARWNDLHLPEFPSMDEIRQRIEERYADTPSVDEIAERAREIFLEHLASALGVEDDPLPQAG
jgi:stearoyl-CoA desaturase (Delta-9 desaturase)